MAGVNARRGNGHSCLLLEWRRGVAHRVEEEGPQEPRRPRGQRADVVQAPVGPPPVPEVPLGRFRVAVLAADPVVGLAALEGREGVEVEPRRRRQLLGKIRPGHVLVGPGELLPLERVDGAVRKHAVVWKIVNPTRCEDLPGTGRRVGRRGACRPTTRRSTGRTPCTPGRRGTRPGARPSRGRPDPPAGPRSGTARATCCLSRTS